MSQYMTAAVSDELEDGSIHELPVEDLRAAASPEGGQLAAVAVPAPASTDGPPPDEEGERATRLALAGVADHVLDAADLPADPAVEAAALGRICALVAGPVFRLRPGRYALRLGEASASALAAVVAEAGGGAATVSAIVPPAADAPEPDPVAVRPVADIPRLGAVLEPRAVPQADADAIVAEAATPAVIEPSGPSPEPSPEASSATSADAALPEGIADDLAALVAAEVARGPRLDAMLEAVRKVVERPAGATEIDAERQGLSRLSSMFQTILRRVDQDAVRLAAAASRVEAVDGALSEMADRLAPLIDEAEVATREAAAEEVLARGLAPLTASVEAMVAMAAASPDLAAMLGDLGRRLDAMERAQAADPRLDQVLWMLEHNALRLDRLAAELAEPDTSRDVMLAAMAAQSERLERLEAMASRAVTGPDIAALGDRTEAMATTFSAAAASLAPLRTQLATVEGRLALVTETLAAVAAELARAPDTRHERDGLLAFAANLQNLLSGIDAQAERLRGIADDAAPLAGTAMNDLSENLQRHRAGLESLERHFAGHVERLSSLTLAAEEVNGATELTADLRLALAEWLAALQRDRAASVASPPVATPRVARPRKRAGAAADAT